MRHAVTCIKLAICLALISAGPAFTQTTDDEATVKKTAPVAYVYVQTTPGVMVFSVAANGTLTPVLGSPFKVTGQMEDISGKFLITVGNTYLHTYPIESNGEIGKQISQTNTASYNGSSECGGTSGQGSVLDHTGKYLYVQLNTLGTCAAWQSYEVDSNGYLDFIGWTEYYEKDSQNDVVASVVPTISSNDKFAYGVFLQGQFTGDYYCLNNPFTGLIYCPSISAFVKGANGELEQNNNFTETDPVNEGMPWVPAPFSLVQADSSGHLAAIMSQDNSGVGWPPQLASYTIDPSTGGISSTNTYSNMPLVSPGYPFAMSMSPSGKLLAIGGYKGGLQIFHFNGAAPPTTFGKVLLPSDEIDQVKWDNHNHLYALNYLTARLFVYTVTPTSIMEAPGSPYYVPDWPYGVKGMVVIP
jgi:hypothetical protein